MNDVLPPCPLCGKFHHPPTSVCSCSCCHKLQLKISPVHYSHFTGQSETNTKWSLTEQDMADNIVKIVTPDWCPLRWTELQSNGKTVRWDCDWPAKFVLTPKLAECLSRTVS